MAEEGLIPSGQPDLGMLASGIVDQLGFPVVVISPEKKISYANPAAHDFLGVPSGFDFSSACCRDLMDFEVCNGKCLSKQIIRPGQVVEKHFVRRRSTGNHYWISTSLLKGFGDDGDYVLHSIRDMEPIVQGRLPAGDQVPGTGVPGGEGISDDTFALERRRIIRTLADNNWRVGRTADSLGYSRVTLWRRMKSLGIKLPNKGN